MLRLDERARVWLVLGKTETLLSSFERKPRSKDQGHGGRKPIPEHLERRETVIDIPNAEKACGNCGRGST